MLSIFSYCYVSFAYCISSLEKLKYFAHFFFFAHFLIVLFSYCLNSSLYILENSTLSNLIGSYFILVCGLHFFFFPLNSVFCRSEFLSLMKVSLFFKIIDHAFDDLKSSLNPTSPRFSLILSSRSLKFCVFHWGL